MKRMKGRKNKCLIRWVYVLQLLFVTSRRILFTVDASAVSSTRRLRPSTSRRSASFEDERLKSFPQPEKQSSPWRLDTGGSSSTVFLMAAAGAINMPSKRLVVSGLLAVTTIHVIRKLYTSEPVRRAGYFWRHAGPIVAHYKFTQRWLKFQQADQEKRDRVYEELHNRYCQPALDIAFHLRGLYVKMGQIMSSRPDFMPPQYVEKFSELQDNIPAWDTEYVQELAVSLLSKECPAFNEEYEDLVLDPVALGSASIGQVHRGVLTRKDNGKQKEVAVKVMHMGSEARFQHDFEVFRWLCRVAIPTWRSLLDALEQQVLTEFDYRNEAASLKEVRANMMRSPYRRRVVIPAPMEELCCEHVLTMEMLHGKKLIDSIEGQLSAAFGGSHEKANEFLSKRRHEVMTGEDYGSKAIIRNSVSLLGKLRLIFLFFRCRRVIDLLVDVHGYQIFRTGTWNGDPHFGNCLQLNDGRLGLIDYGQTRRIDDQQRKEFSRVVVALCDGKREHLSDIKPLVKHHTFDAAAVSNAMRNAGFATKNNTDDDIMLQYARLLFDSDEESEKRGFVIPQEYFASLMSENPLVEMPDSAIFVARTSLMFRGMGHAIGDSQIGTASRWYKNAKKTVTEDGGK